MRCLAALPFFCLLAASPAVAADVFSLYSDVCYHVEGGDLLGQRIGILRLTDATYVFLQSAEGVFAQPMIGRASASDLRQGKLVFSVSDEGRPLSFRGTITQKSVSGQFNGWFGDKGKPLTVRLNRVAVSQKGAPDCR